MGNAALVKPLAEAILHLKKCKDDPEQCKTCAQGAIRLGAALSETMEVAELFRRLLSTAQVPGAPK